MEEKGLEEAGGTGCLETNSSASQTESREWRPPLGPVLARCVSLLESSADFQELSYRVQHSCNGTETLTVTRDTMTGLLGGMLDPVSISLTSSGQCYLSVLFRPLQAIDLKPLETGDLDLAAFEDGLHKLTGQAGYGFCPAFQPCDFPRGLEWQSHGLELLDSPCSRVQAQGCPVFWQLRPPGACPEGRGLGVQWCPLCARAVADLYGKLKGEGRDVSSPAFVQVLSSGCPPVYQSVRSVSSTEKITVESERWDSSEHHSSDSNAVPLETQGKEETMLPPSSEDSEAPCTTATCKRKTSDTMHDRGSSDGLSIRQSLTQDKMDEEPVEDTGKLGSEVCGSSSTRKSTISTRTPASANSATTAGITAASSTSLLPKQEELPPSPLPAHASPSGAMASNLTDLLHNNSAPASLSVTAVTHSSTSTVSDDVMNVTPSTSDDVRTSMTITTSSTVSDDAMSITPSTSSDVRTSMTTTTSSTVSDDVMNLPTSTSGDVMTTITTTTPTPTSTPTTTTTTTSTSTPQDATSSQHTAEVSSLPVPAAPSVAAAAAAAASSTDRSPDLGSESTAAACDLTCCTVSGAEQQQQQQTPFTCRGEGKEGTAGCQSCCSGRGHAQSTAEDGGESEGVLVVLSASSAAVLAEPERKKPCHRCPVCLDPFPSRSLCTNHLANCRPSPDDSCTPLISPAPEDANQRTQEQKSRQPAFSLRLVSDRSFRRTRKLRKHLTGVHTMKSPGHKQCYNTLFPCRRNAGTTSMQGKGSVISVGENWGNTLRRKNLLTARLRNQRSKLHQLQYAFSKLHRQQITNAKYRQKLDRRNKKTGKRKQKIVRGIFNIATKPMSKKPRSYYSDRLACKASPLSAQQPTKGVNSVRQSSNSLLHETNPKAQQQEKSHDNPDLRRTPLLDCGVLNKPYLSTNGEINTSGRAKDKEGYRPEAPSLHSSISLQYSSSTQRDSDTSHIRYTLSDHTENRATTDTEHSDGKNSDHTDIRRRGTNDGRHTDTTDKPGDASNVRACGSGDVTDSEHGACKTVDTTNLNHHGLPDLRQAGDRETQLAAKEQELLQKELELQQREMTLTRQSQLVQQLVREWNSSLQSDSDQPVNTPREDSAFSPQQFMVEFLTLMKAMVRKKNGQTVTTVKRIAPKPSPTSHQQSTPPSRARTEQLTEAAKPGYTGTLSGTEELKTEVKTFCVEAMPDAVYNGPVPSREPLAQPPALAHAALCTSAVSLSDLASNDSLKRRCSLSFSACTPPSPAPCASYSSAQKEEARASSSSSSLTGKQGCFLEEVMRLAPRLPKSAREFLPTNQPRNLPPVMPCYGSTSATVASKAVPPVNKLPQRWNIGTQGNAGTTGTAGTKGNAGTRGTGGTGQSRSLSLSGGEMKETPSFIQEKLLSPLVRVSAEEMERLLLLGNKNNTPCVTLGKSELRASALLCNLSSSCGHQVGERSNLTSQVAKTATSLILLPPYFSHDTVSKTSPPPSQHVGTPHLAPLPPLLPTSASDCGAPITPTSAPRCTPPHCSPTFDASAPSENTGPLDLTMKTSNRAPGCSPVSNGSERRSQTEQGSGEIRSLSGNQTIHSRHILSSKAQPPSTCSQVSDIPLRSEHHVDAYPLPSTAVPGNKNHKRRSKDKNHRHQFSNKNAAQKPSLHNNELCQPKSIGHIIYANTYTPSVLTNRPDDEHNHHRADRMTHHSIPLNGIALPRERQITGGYENIALKGVLAPGVFLMPVSETGSAWSMLSGTAVTETSSMCAPEKAGVKHTQPATSLTNGLMPTSLPTPLNLSSSSPFISSSPGIKSQQPAHTNHMLPTIPRLLWTGIPVASMSAASPRGPPILPMPSPSLTRPPVLEAAPASPSVNPTCTTSMSPSGSLLLSPSGLIPAPIQLMPCNGVTTEHRGHMGVIRHTYTPVPSSMEQKDVFPGPVFHSSGSGMASSSKTLQGERQEETVVEDQLSRKGGGGGQLDQRKGRPLRFEREEGNDDMERKGRQFYSETGEGTEGLEWQGRQFHFERNEENDGLERKGRTIQPERREVGGEVMTWLHKQTQMQEQMLRVLRKKRQQQQQERRRSRSRLSCDSGGQDESK